jgi:hypothetical protein
MESGGLNDDFVPGDASVDALFNALEQPANSSELEAWSRLEASLVSVLNGSEGVSPITRRGPRLRSVRLTSRSAVVVAGVVLFAGSAAAAARSIIFSEPDVQPVHITTPHDGANGTTVGAPGSLVLTGNVSGGGSPNDSVVASDTSGVPALEMSPWTTDPAALAETTTAPETTTPTVDTTDPTANTAQPGVDATDSPATTVG